MGITSLISGPTRMGRRLLSLETLETLVAPNGFDRYGELLDPVWSMRDVRAKIESVRRTTPRSITLTLRPNSNWQGFEAGQHVGLTVEVDGVLQTRFYSPASSALRSDGLIELTVTAHPEGKVSQHLLVHADVGAVVGLSPAEGEFVLPEQRPRKLLLIGGGSGITPVMSMLRTLSDEGFDGEITFVHYARTAKDAIYAAELNTFPDVHVKQIFTRAGGAKNALSGHLTREQLAKIDPDYAAAEAFVCGPNSLIEAAERIWSAEGIRERLHTESFVLPEPVIVAGDATGSVTFSKSEVQSANDGTTLLDQAEAAGLSPRCGCRMGICHTCIAHIDEGAVRDVRTGEVKTVKNEYVQICVNAPVGDIDINL